VTGNCKKCGKIKRGRYLDKRQNKVYSYCKPCRNELSNIRYHNKREHIRQQANKWHLQNGVKKARLRHVKNKYKLSEVDYVKLEQDCNNQCMICHGSPDRNYLCIDHDHKTKKVRGLLCTRCNAGIGNFKDSLRLLESAIKYLENFNDDRK
jgi:hypothetical protein